MNDIPRLESIPPLAGLWLHVPALLRRDLATVLSTVQRGLASPEHGEFVQRLQQRRI